MTAFALVNDELRNRFRSSIGRRWRISTSTNRTKNTAETANRPSTSGSPQPWSLDSIRAYVRAKSAIAEVASPARSSRCSVVSRDSSMKIRAATRPAIPIGMLM